MIAVSQCNRVVRSRWLVIFTLCASAVALSNVVAPDAAATGSHSTATMIKSVVVSGVAPPPGAPNNPSALIVANTDFSVTVTFSDQYGTELPLSWNHDVTVSLSVQPPAPGEPPSSGGDAQFVGEHTIVVPAGAATVTGSGFALNPPENRIRLGAEIVWGDAYPKDIPMGFSAQFDVVLRAVTAEPDQTFLSTSGGATGCVPSSYDPYCVDLRLPFGSETGSVLTIGECDSFLGCISPDQVVVQALADLGPSYSKSSPAVAVFKCDKKACWGGQIKKYHVFATLSATGPLAQAPACSRKGVVNHGVDFCVDYRQSKRDQAGDTHLYLLLARDARMSCC